MLKFRITAHQNSARKTILQVTRQCIGVIAHENGTDAAFAGRHQYRPERALADGEAYFSIGPTGAVVGRRHAQDLTRLFVKTPVGTVAGTIDRLGDCVAPFQLGADAGSSMGRRVSFWGHTGDGLEDAMQVVGAESGIFRQFMEAGCLFGLLDESAQFGHQDSVLLGHLGLIRLTSFAGAKTGAFGICGSKMELHVLGPGGSRCARGTTIDPGGFN
ncbi:hypothetical protein NTG1052_380009 [Candidatus Nitrotoga sp. 1052]|nr:hypothetical protein NTG1052_380009 [Candidatus Nitrotoga sp. 1052]